MHTKIIRAKYLVTNAALREQDLLANAAVCVEGSTIVKIGDPDDLRAAYPQAELLGDDRHIALPGFIDAHNHGQGITTWSGGASDDMLEVWIHSWPGHGEVLLHMAAVGVCGSDAHNYPKGRIGSQIVTDPVVLGYEFSASRVTIVGDGGCDHHPTLSQTGDGDLSGKPGPFQVRRDAAKHSRQAAWLLKARCRLDSFQSSRLL